MKLVSDEKAVVEDFMPRVLTAGHAPCNHGLRGVLRHCARNDVRFHNRPTPSKPLPTIPLIGFDKQPRHEFTEISSPNRPAMVAGSYDELMLDVFFLEGGRKLARIFDQAIFLPARNPEQVQVVFRFGVSFGHESVWVPEIGIHPVHLGERLAMSRPNAERLPAAH